MGEITAEIFHWEIKERVKNQSEGRSTPLENPLFPSSGSTLQKRPGFITEVAEFQQWDWPAQTMCPPRLHPSEQGLSA